MFVCVCVCVWSAILLGAAVVAAVAARKPHKAIN